MTYTSSATRVRFHCGAVDRHRDNQEVAMPHHRTEDPAAVPRKPGPRDPRTRPAASGGGNEPQGYGDEAERRPAHREGSPLSSSGCSKAFRRSFRRRPVGTATRASALLPPAVSRTAGRPEDAHAAVNQYIAENGGDGQGYDRGYTAARAEPRRRAEPSEPACAGVVGRSESVRLRPALPAHGRDAAPRPGPPTGDGGTRTGGYGEPPPAAVPALEATASTRPAGPVATAAGRPAHRPSGPHA